MQMNCIIPSSAAACLPLHGKRPLRKGIAMSNVQMILHPQGNASVSANLLFVTASKLEEDARTAPQTHPYAEFFYVLRGELDFEVEGELFSLREDDLLVVNPDASHREYPRGPGTVEYVSLGIEGLFLDPDASGMWSGSCLLHCRAMRSEARFFLRLLLSELERTQSDFEKLCLLAFESLLLCMRRVHPQEFTISSPKRTARECSAIKRYIDVHFRDPISLDRLAEVCGLNKYYLAHAFREYIGMSPINYLNARRVEEAGRLLCSTNDSISQIASTVGFSSQSYFAQVFQKSTGESPGEYRKRHRKNCPDKTE